jgi:hypothetical protein
LLPATTGLRKGGGGALLSCAGPHCRGVSFGEEREIPPAVSRGSGRDAPELRSPTGRAPDESGRGLMLYRGETPGAVGCDVHGGYGQTWTLEPSHARGYARGEGGVVRVAILPPTAKRLVLVDPVTDEYNWEGLAELERVVDDPLIADRVRAGNQIYDIWRPAWTLLLVEAGYDSIATVGIEGPEEYVLKPEVLVFDEQASSSARRNGP